MTVVLSGDDEKFVAEQIRGGRFADALEVVRGGFIALQRTDAIDEQMEKLKSGLDQEWLRNEIAVGIAEADQGLCEPWNAEEIITEGRRLLAESRKSRE